MIFIFLNIFNEVLKRVLSVKGSSNDLSNLYFVKLTPVLLLVLFILTMTRMVFFEKITCAAPLEWRETWIDFANEVCFVDNTYYKQYINSSTDDRIRLNHYQWMPYFFILLAGLFFLPVTLWQFMCKGFRIDVNHVLKICKQMEKKDRCDIDTGVMYVCNMFWNISRLRKENDLSKRLGRLRAWFDGKTMPAGYMIMKTLYILNAFLQLVFIKHVIQAPSMTFGLSMLVNFFGDTQWETSTSFPRMTWCDIQPHVHEHLVLSKIQCVLPANSFYEKAFIILWIWVIFGLLLLLISGLYWTVFFGRILSHNHGHMKRQLSLMLLSIDLRVRPAVVGSAEDCYADSSSEPMHFELVTEKVDIFIVDYLRPDGLFMLKIVENNFGEILVQTILGKMWTQYCLECVTESSDSNDRLSS